MATLAGIPITSNGLGLMSISPFTLILFSNFSSFVTSYVKHCLERKKLTPPSQD